MSPRYHDGSHRVEIHTHPLNDGTAWYRIVCSCGWANADQVGSARRCYSKAVAEDLKRDHIEEVKVKA